MSRNKPAVAPAPAPGRGPWPWLAAALLAAHAALGIGAVFSLSQTYDEAVHLAVGYSFWKSGEYRVDPVGNTPLPRLLGSLPLLALDPDPMFHDPAYGRKGGEFAYAYRFLHGNRVPAERLLHAARLALFLLLSPLLGWAVFRWARHAAGPAAGLCALALYAFNPVLLSNATLVTADFTGAAFVFLSLAVFARALRPGAARRPLVMLGGFLAGLALGSKHSAVVLLAVLPAVAALRALLLGRPVLSRAAAIDGLAAVCGMCLALALVYQPRQLPLWWQGLHETLSMAGRGTERGRLSYLLGEVSSRGWWYYFPLVFLMKTPIPFLLALAAAAKGLASLEREARAELLSFAAAPAALWMAAACLSRYQIGVRHILPVFPLCCVVAGAGLAHLWRMAGWPRWGAGLLVGWYAFGTLRLHPHYLAYFNEAAGGPEQGYKRLVDSNLDWGQSLKELGALLKSEGDPPIYLCYFGTADPHLYGIRFVPVGYYGEVPRPGDAVEPFRAGRVLFAISATDLVGVHYNPKTLMRWLAGYEPYKVLGHSIFVFDFTREPEALAYIARILIGGGDRERGRALARRLSGPKTGSSD